MTEKDSAKGGKAQIHNIRAAKTVAETVKTTLGPMGMDKMMVDGGGNVIVTNDGATILRELDVSHPGGKMIAEVARHPRVAVLRWNNDVGRPFGTTARQQRDAV